MQSAYVFSVAPYVAVKKVFPYGPEIHVKARAEGEEFSVTEIRPAKSHKDFGNDRYEYYEVLALDIANDLIRDVETQGVWAGTEPVPTREAIDAAKAKQVQFYMTEIAQADSDWARFQDPRKISTHAVLGARELNMKRPWAVDVSTMVQCRGCKELVAPGAVKCSHCASILDWDGAIELGLVTEEQYRFAKKRGLTETEEAAPKKAAK